MEQVNAQTASASNRLIAISAGVIVAAFLVKIVLFAAGNTHHQFDGGIDVVIFGFLAILFLARGIRFYGERKRGLAVAAFVGTLCWAIYTVLIVVRMTN